MSTHTNNKHYQPRFNEKGSCGNAAVDGFARKIRPEPAA